MSRPQQLVISLALAGGLLLLVLPLWTDRVAKDDPWRRVASLDQVSAVFESYHRETGLWPCAWGGDRSSVAPLSEYQCLRSQGFSGKIVDRWGNLIRVVYQAPSEELERAEHGVVSLVSTGPDGELQTLDSEAVAGRATGDDLVRVVTRNAR